jgi:Xaa-Pro aminopeptidase
MWPQSSPAQCFVERRSRFLKECQLPCALGSGVVRVRNFEANRFPFRAESHFLYFVGRHLQEALLVFDGERAELFVDPPDPAEALWHGEQPSLEQLSEQLQLVVRPLDDFEAPEGVATLPSADVETTAWLEELLDRRLEPAAGPGSEQDVELAQTMIELRLRQDAGALEQMRAAASVSAQAHRAAMAATRVGDREAAPRAAVEAVMAAAGMTPAYTSIVTTRGDVLHHESSLNQMQDGDLLLVDAGAETPEGWASDITRTWPVSGRFASMQAEVYDAVLAAQLAAIEQCRVGVRFRDVHRTAAQVLIEGLRSTGLLKGSLDELLDSDVAAVFFPHGIGHLLGLDVHDMEDLGDLAGYGDGRVRSTTGAERYLRLDRDLERDMVVTIEPGFYRIERLLHGPAFAAIEHLVDAELLGSLNVRGIRIEDDVRVTDAAAEVLSSSAPKTRAEIEAAVGG